MKIIVTCPDTVFGDLVKSFDSYVDALIWVETCILNQIKVVITQA